MNLFFSGWDFSPLRKAAVSQSIAPARLSLHVGGFLSPQLLFPASVTLVFILAAGRGAWVPPDMLEGWSRQARQVDVALARGRERSQEGRAGKRRPVAAGGVVVVVVVAGLGRGEAGRSAG